MLLFFTFLLSFFTTFVTTKHNQAKINRIINTLNHADLISPGSSPTDPPKDEYDYICNHIIQNFLEKDYLRILLSEKKYRLHSMELLTLQSQINPHFLFNTLKTIYWKSFALSSSQNDVSLMVENLSAILDYSLSSPKEDAPLAQEVRIAESYLNIQAVRYPNKLSVIWKVSPDTLAVPIMKMILQPLIENSIYHGIREKDGLCIIRIKIFQHCGFLHIFILDTGLGISRVQLSQLRAALQGEQQEQHIGLQNTYKRLQLRYGESCRLWIYSSHGKGTSVQIHIPAEK